MRFIEGVLYTYCVWRYLNAFFPLIKAEKQNVNLAYLLVKPNGFHRFNACNGQGGKHQQ